jgi:NAD(P)-dependent dehydrogenase (short-subunit alcohol dehydrogenase family)
MMATETQGAVLITGTSSGLGRALALHLDAQGTRVFAAVRRPEDAAAWRERSATVTPVFLDVGDQASVARAAAEVERALGGGGLDALVNNAGVSFRAPLEAVRLDELRRLFEVNVVGVVAVTQAFLPLLRRRGGRILNVSSLTSFLVTPFHGPYSASKACLSALSRALRLELLPLGVHVSTLVVGGVQTALWDKVGRLSEEACRGAPPEVMALYGDRLRRALALFTRRGKAGLTAEEAARRVARALVDPRPQGVYLVGRDARFYWWLTRLLPERVLERIIQGQLR